MNLKTKLFIGYVLLIFIGAAIIKNLAVNPQLMRLAQTVYVVSVIITGYIMTFIVYRLEEGG